MSVYWVRQMPYLALHWFLRSYVQILYKKSVKNKRGILFGIGKQKIFLPFSINVIPPFLCRGSNVTKIKNFCLLISLNSIWEIVLFFFFFFPHTVLYYSVCSVLWISTHSFWTLLRPFWNLPSYLDLLIRATQLRC